MLIKKFVLSPKVAFARYFSKYYTFEDSVFNFALSINAKNILDGDKFSKTTETINEAYKKGIDRLVIRLKDNNDIDDVSYVVSQIKQLKEKLPDLQIQGLRYPMKFNLKTKEFLHNEFLFGLQASKLISSSLYPQVFFLAESNELFKAAFNKEDQKGFEKQVFNFDALEEVQRSLDFANLVFMLKYEEGLTTEDNLRNFYDKFKQKNIGFDLDLNKIFAKEAQSEKKKNTAEFIKHAYAYEPHIKALSLYDFAFVEEEIEQPEKGLEEELAVPQTPANAKKIKKIKQVDLGQGVFDFKLLMSLIKMSKFKGIVIFPENTSSDAMDMLNNLAKESQFLEKDGKEVLQYVKHKEDQKSKEHNREGAEYRF